MSYATIEEAWGGLGKETPPATPRIAAPKQAIEKPAPGVTFEDGRKYVRAVYAQYGLKGVLELLGEDVSKRLCGGLIGGKRRRVTLKSETDWFTLTPEKMLLLIVVLFGAIALVDGLGSKTAQGGSPPPW